MRFIFYFSKPIIKTHHHTNTLFDSMPSSDVHIKIARILIMHDTVQEAKNRSAIVVRADAIWDGCWCFVQMWWINFHKTKIPWRRAIKMSATQRQKAQKNDIVTHTCIYGPCSSYSRRHSRRSGLINDTLYTTRHRNIYSRFPRASSQDEWIIVNK